MSNLRVLLIALLAPFVSSGCASLPADLPDSAVAELAGTPFFPQERYQCGPAALATVLVASGIETTPARLVDQVYVPAVRGSLQSEMLAAARAAGRLPYVLDPSFADLVAELEAGRPVLVMQNLGVAWLPRWHYAVVVGYDPLRGVVLLRSGTDRRRETPVRLFLRTWQRSRNWALVTLEPGELPALPDAARFFEAAAAFEAVAEGTRSLEVWKAALSKWPDRGLPAFALGNLEFAARRYAVAAAWYRRAIQIDPDYVLAYNNLAHALAQLGRQQDARHELLTGIAIAGARPAQQAILLESLAELDCTNDQRLAESAACRAIIPLPPGVWHTN